MTAMNENRLVQLVEKIKNEGIMKGDTTELKVTFNNTGKDYDENYTYFLDVIALERELEAEKYKNETLTKELDFSLKTINELTTLSPNKMRIENIQLRSSALANLDAANNLRTTYDARVKTYTQIVAKLQKELKALKEAK